jgi:MFS family permease
MGSKEYKWAILLTSSLLMMFLFMIQITWLMSLVEEVEAGENSINDSFGIAKYSVAMLGFTIPVFTQGIGNFFQGNLIHRIGFRKTFLIFVPFLIVPQFIIPYLPDLVATSEMAWAICLALRTIQGFGLTFGVLSPLVGLWFPLKQRGLAQGIFMTFVGLNSGIGAVYASAFDRWEEAFLVLGAAILVLSVIWLIVVREPPTSQESSEEKRQKSTRSIYRFGATWMVVWLISINCWVIFGSTGNAPVYLKSIGVEETWLPILFFALASVISTPISGMLSDRWIPKMGAIKARSIAIAIGFGIATIFAAIYPKVAIEGLAIAAVATFLLGFGGPWTSSPGWALPADLDPYEAGKISGLALIVGQAAGGISGQVIAATAEFSWSTAWYVLAIGAAIGIIPCLLLPRMVGKGDQQ